jgi:hypothetical protein
MPNQEKPSQESQGKASREKPSQEKPSTAGPRVEEQFDDAVKRIRELNERVIEAAKQSGRVSLDAYERSLKDLLDFEKKVANATQLDWVNALASAHAKFISDVSQAYTQAARELLK